MFSKLLKYLDTTRFKTTLWYSLLFLLLEVVIGITTFTYLSQSLRKELDLSLTKQANMIYHLVKESDVDLSAFKPDSIYSSPSELFYDLVFEAVAYNPSNTMIQVRLDSIIIFNTANLSEHKINSDLFNNDSSGLCTFSDPLLSSHPLRAAYLNKNNYQIIVAFPTHIVTQTLDILIKLFIIIAPIFFFLSLIVGSIISFKAFSRIDKIIQRTEQITADNLNEIIEGENYSDEYGRLVTTMNSMIKRIRTSIEYMNQFSSSVSHELKTPLTILRGEIELALRSKKTPEEYHQILESNYEETLRLINIIERLFYLSKLENSQINLNKIQVKIKPFLQSLIKSFSNLAEAKQINLVLDCNKLDDFEIQIDPDLFRRAVSNLIDNSIKYGKEKTDVLIQCNRSTENKIIITFMNYCEEIPKEILPKLFDKFYRSEYSRNRNLGGMGLGLSIVKSIIDLHNGQINVETIDNEKIIFTIII